MQVKRAILSDIPAVWQLTRELQHEGEAMHPDLAIGMNEYGVMLAYHRVMGWVLSEGIDVLLVMDGDVAVGYMHLQYIPFVGSENATIASSCGFYIRPEYRRGRAILLLYRAARERLRSRGMTHVQAVVLTENAETRNLYLEHGYREVATIYQRDIRRVNPDGWRDTSREVVAAVGPSGHENGAAGGGGLHGEPGVSADRRPGGADPRQSDHADAAGGRRNEPASHFGRQPWGSGLSC